jgi:hypothetical protein
MSSGRITKSPSGLRQSEFGLPARYGFEFSSKSPRRFRW